MRINGKVGGNLLDYEVWNLGKWVLRKSKVEKRGWIIVICNVKGIGEDNEVKLEKKKKKILIK